jgi:hypothetical protein
VVGRTYDEQVQVVQVCQPKQLFCWRVRWLWFIAGSAARLLAKAGQRLDDHRQQVLPLSDSVEEHSVEQTCVCSCSSSSFIRQSRTVYMTDLWFYAEKFCTGAFTDIKFLKLLCISRHLFRHLLFSPD